MCYIKVSQQTHRITATPFNSLGENSTNMYVHILEVTAVAVFSVSFCSVHLFASEWHFVVFVDLCVSDDFQVWCWNGPT